MRIRTTEIAGVAIIDIEPREDERGFFADLWSSDELAGPLGVAHFNRSALSYNASAGTLRGLHYQAAPHEEAKLVRCTRGAVFDVAVDLRQSSETYGRWTGAMLSADSRRAFFIPKGCAHGFQTLEDDTEVLYCIEGQYVPDAGRIVAWNDRSIGIAWPETSRRIMSANDAEAPELGTK